MPDRDVKTIQDLIYFQYAKQITRSAFHLENGSAAKKKYYGFIKKTFKDLKSNTKKWSDILREDLQLVEAEKSCVYCGSTENLSKEHIVPKTLNINERCHSCDTIQSIHNIVWACRSCNSQKGTRGLYHFFKERHPDNEKYFDYLPSLLEKKYLKTIYKCHQCNGTLEKNKEDLSVLDIDL